MPVFSSFHATFKQPNALAYCLVETIVCFGSFMGVEHNASVAGCRSFTCRLFLPFQRSNECGVALSAAAARLVCVVPGSVLPRYPEHYGTFFTS